MRKKYILMSALIIALLLDALVHVSSPQRHSALPHELHDTPTPAMRPTIILEPFVTSTPQSKITPIATPTPTATPTPRPAYWGCDLWHAPQNCPNLIDSDFVQRQDLFPWGSHQSEEMLIELGMEDGKYRWDIFSTTPRLIYHWITPHERSLHDKRIQVKGRLIDHSPMLSWGLVFQHTSPDDIEESSPTVLYYLGLTRLSADNQMYGLFEIRGDKVTPVWGWRKLTQTSAQWLTLTVYQKGNSLTVYANGIEVALLSDITTEDGFGIAVFADGLRQYGMLEIDTLVVTLPTERPPQ